MRARHVRVIAWRDTPLCPARHLPLKGGEWMGAPSPLRLTGVFRAFDSRLRQGGRHDSFSPLEGRAIAYAIQNANETESKQVQIFEFAAFVRCLFRICD